MADTLTPEERSERMRLIRGDNTKPELIVRKMVFSMGYRYRLHHGKLPGKPDIVFPGRKKVIFVHGCFWHRHNCRHGRSLPKTNVDFWEKKFKENRKRDKKDLAKLHSLDWEVLVIWQCQCRDEKALKIMLERFLHHGN